MKLAVSNKKVGVTAFLLFVFALLFRLYFIAETVWDNPIRGDAGYYTIYAGNLINYQVFSRQQGAEPKPDSYWAPGYPSFLAINTVGARYFNLYDFSVILKSQAVLSSIVVAMTFLLGRMFLPYGWALSASVLAMFSPHLISYSGVLLTETLFSFLLLCSIYFFCRFVNYKSAGAGIISGIFFGIAYLTNPVSLFLPFLISLVAIFIKKSITARKTFLFLAVFLAIAFSWSIRNAVNVDEGASSGTNRLYSNLVVGAHEDYHRIWRANPRDPNNPATLDMAEFKGSYWSFADAMAGRISTRPLHYLKWYFIDKPIALWQWNVGIGFGDVFVINVVTSPYHFNNLAIASHVLMKSMHYWLLFFALLGILMGAYNWKASNVTTLVTISTLVYISSIYVITQSDARYSVPLRPEMYLLAMFFLEKIYIWVHRTQNQARKS